MEKFSFRYIIVAFKIIYKQKKTMIFRDKLKRVFQRRTVIQYLLALTTTTLNARKFSRKGFEPDIVFS